MVVAYMILKVLLYYSTPNLRIIPLSIYINNVQMNCVIVCMSTHNIKKETTHTV